MIAKDHVYLHNLNVSLHYYLLSTKGKNSNFTMAITLTVESKLIPQYCNKPTSVPTEETH